MREAWQRWQRALSKEKCDELVNLCKATCILKDGTTFNSDKQHRQTKVAFTENPQIKQIAQDYALAANRAVFGFDVDYIPAIQFGEYSQGSFYGWHHDIDWHANRMYDRKLSIVIQLTNETEYEGGFFEFKSTETPRGFRSQGSILVFPSYLEHQVTKITQGTRYSLVCWAEGPRWR